MSDVQDSDRPEAGGGGLLGFFEVFVDNGIVLKPSKLLPVTPDPN